jgi:hypothetical protein
MTTYQFPLSGQGIAASKSWTLDQGVDVAAPGHTKLVAIGDGEIVGHGISGFGSWAPILKLTSGPLKGRFVYYGHAGPGHELAVGTKVHAGDVIGEVGAGIVGISSGPHLEIGFASTAAGQPAGEHTAKSMRDILAAARSGGGVLDAVKDAAGAVVGAPKKAVDAATGAAGDVAQEAAKATFNLFWDTVAKNAMRVLLYVLLIFGGLALAFGGVKRLSRPAEATT